MQTILRSGAMIKLVHTIIYLLMSGLLLGFLYEVIADRITLMTWLAVGVLLIEGIVLMVNGWHCPLETYGKGIGAIRADEADIYLPKWFANQIFPVSSSLFAFALVLLGFRVLQ
jgi:hypothetical protein